MISCDQTASGTAKRWGTAVAWAFLHSLLFLVLEPTLLPLPLHRSGQLLGYGFAVTFVKEKKNAILAYVLSFHCDFKRNSKSLSVLMRNEGARSVWRLLPCTLKHFLQELHIPILSIPSHAGSGSHPIAL